ncbi:unnamed protein product [Phyllotreta striolata]|uniref:Tudor domain-containing protein 5 n=1 Tax=Phyllotreta striolata TaxID=444603 RepID=A0A9N9TK29_PHYSR|nr:unnamed protein product [Phyllotreta striolata]
MEAEKRNLRGILTANPRAMTIRQLNAEYYTLVGYNIPYKQMGYHTLEDFLHSIPDTVQVQGSGAYALVNIVLSQKSSHVLELVAKQKKQPLKRNTRMPVANRRVVVPDWIPAQRSRKIFYPPPPPAAVAAPAASRSDYQNPNKPIQNLQSGSSVATKETLQQPRSNSNPAATIPKPSRFNNNTNTYKNNVPKLSPNVDSSQAVSEVSKAFEQVKLTSTPNHVALESLNRSHSSGAGFISDQRHNIVTPKKNNMFNKLNNIQSISGNSSISPLIENSEDRIPETVRKNLQVLIGKFPDGIWCTEIPETYSNMFRRKLVYQEYGFGKLMDLCTYLSSIFHCVQASSDDYKLYDKSKPLPADAKNNLTASNSTSKKIFKDDLNALPKVDFADILLFLPPNVFKPGNEIPRTFVPDDMKQNDTMEVVIGEIYDISKFWVSRNDGKLDDLMNDIQEFYGENGKEYKIPHDFIREGLYCVAMIFGEYHRALIVDIMNPNDEMIRVFFIDYGTVAKVKSDLYFLHEQFAKLPSQTIRCSLANIRPPVKGSPWSYESSQEFRRLVKQRNLVVRINRIDRKDQYLDVFLADVTNPQNIFYINNVLVEKGFAVRSDQEQKASISDALSKPIVQQIHLFPTFWELEYGLAPSTLEMEVFHKCNTPINFCYPQYFDFDLSKEESVIRHTEKFYEENILKGIRNKMRHQQDFDLREIKDKPMDFSIFGDLEQEMRTFYKTECAGDNEEVTDENMYPTNNEMVNRALNSLRQDTQLSKDIINDINSIIDLKSSITESDYESEYSEDCASTGEIEGAAAKMPSDEDHEAGVYRHPLQDVCFSPSNSSGSSDSVYNPNPFDSKSLLIETKNEVAEELSSLKSSNPNNPFLSSISLSDPKCDIISDDGRLSSTNPFLSYNQELNEESHSDVSKYGIPKLDDVPVYKSWSLGDQVTSDMSMSSYDEPSGVVIEECTSETVEAAPKKAVQVLNNTNWNVNTPEFFPQNVYCPPAYVYPYLYNMGYPGFNVPMHPMQPNYNFTQVTRAVADLRSRVPPPPGFNNVNININYLQNNPCSDYTEFLKRRLS